MSRDVDMHVPSNASAAEAAGWEARILGEPDRPPQAYSRTPYDFNGWLRGWDMANNRLQYRIDKR